MVQAYSIGKDTRKDISQAPKFVPGPGAYNSNTKNMNQSASWGFGSSKRPQMALVQASKDIGPGQYQLPNKAIEGSKYTMGAINHKQKKYGSISPGPGAYVPDTKIKEKSLSYSMGSKFESVLINKDAGKTPGPGGYNPKMGNFKYDGHTKFGTGQRGGIMDERHAKFVPSPFQYKQDAHFIQKSMPKFSFGSEKQRPQTSKTSMVVPGPGTYPSRTIVGSESVGKTMGMKICPAFEKAGANNVPGPGAYSGNYKTTRTAEPGWRIGTGTRYDRDNIMRRTCNFPPMNAYNPEYRKTQGKEPSWGFGSSVRGGLVEGKVISPSMQTYNIPSKVVEKSSWSMGLKLSNSCAIGADNEKQKHLPGPGAYQPKFATTQKQKPLFSMKGRYKPQKKLDVPGPGTYDKSMMDKKSAPQFGFGSSPQREAIKKTLSPGPGGYHIPVKLGEVPAYALPNRKDDVKYI